MIWWCCNVLPLCCFAHFVQSDMRHDVSACVDLGTTVLRACCIVPSVTGAANRGVLATGGSVTLADCFSTRLALNFDVCTLVWSATWTCRFEKWPLLCNKGYFCNLIVVICSKPAKWDGRSFCWLVKCGIDTLYDEMAVYVIWRFIITLKTCVADTFVWFVLRTPIGFFSDNTSPYKPPFHCITYIYGGMQHPKPVFWHALDSRYAFQ